MPANQPPQHSRRRRVLATLAAGVTAAGAVALVLDPLAANAVETIALPSTGTITVHGNGNGHGHGMSQYGAKGAALAGLSAAQIVHFYYPGTTLVTLGTSPIRVWISRAGSYPTVAAVAGLSLTGVSGTLGTTGIARYRLVASGTGLAVQKLGSAAGSTWQTAQTGLPATAKFSTTSGFVRTYLSDGTSTDYRGAIGGVRAGTGVTTVNYLTLDQYTEGVAPRESPASWPAAAVQAQAIAARTYGRNAVESHSASSYDICDTSQCQEYGGMTHYNSAGQVLWTDDPAALSGNANQVLQLNGATIFSQFSASDGGWTVDGGQPYLIAQADPYDNAASGDPYLDWVQTPSVASIAGYYGMARATDIRITARDGHGDWGGRVLSAIVDGVDSGGTAMHVSTTGFGLQDALGLLTNWFGFSAPVQTPGGPTGVTATASDSGVLVSWSPPTSSGGSAITGYVVSFGSLSMTLGASARSAFAGPRVNGSTAVVQVRARNAAGTGPAASVAAVPTALPQSVQVLPAARLFDSRSPAVTVDATHPFQLDVSGKAGIPATGAKGVQLALTIVRPTTSGVLRIRTAGEVGLNTAAVAYQAGRVSTVTVDVPLFASSSIVFTPSSGSLGLVGDVLSYSGGTNRELTAIAPKSAAALASVPIGDGVAVPVRATVGTSATAVMVRVNATTATTTGYLRVWSEGTAPGVSQISVSPGGTNSNVVLVPIGSDGSIRIASSSSAIGASVTILGVVGPSSTAGGSLESFQPYGTSDPVRGTPALATSATPVSAAVLGSSGVPSTGVQLVLVHVTVSGASAAGTLTVYPAGGSKPATPSLSFAPGDPASVTLAVQPGTNGALSYVTSGPTATVAVDITGYVTG